MNQEPHDRQLVRATFKDGHTELARFYRKSISLNGKPGFETRQPARIWSADEVTTWEPADESELDK